MNVTGITTGTLAIGQSVTGSGVTPGTLIVSGGAGTGSTGIYLVNNSQTVGSETLTVPATSNQIVQVDNQAGAVARALTYRAGGDLYQDQAVGGALYEYDYNAAKRMVEVKQNGTQEGGYAYDFLGQRVWREQYGSGAKTAYFYDENGHVLAEHNATTGAVELEYVWLDNLPVAMIDSTGMSPATYYIHTGQIDEPLALTNSSASLAWNAYVDPFGTATTFSTPTETINLRLPGQWIQSEANGTSQNQFRDYDPSLGRYIEGDPIGILGGQNAYAYVDGDPLNLVDPPGLCAPTRQNPLCSPNDKQVVRNAALDALSHLNPNQNEANNVEPYTGNFAQVINPANISTTGWQTAISTHGTAVESPIIPGQNTFSVKMYNDPSLGNTIAVDYPAGTPAHVLLWPFFRSGLDVNAFVARLYLHCKFF